MYPRDRVRDFLVGGFSSNFPRQEAAVTTYLPAEARQPVHVMACSTSG